MALKLFQCSGGHVAVPDRSLVLVSREDGGNLVVNPPSEVWDRSELSARELTLWSFLVAATGRAMLDVLPQLHRGCINYWDAGNWALNEEFEPRGRKSGPVHRRVHLHLLGRSRDTTHPAWRWGEAPVFPDFANRHAWAAGFERLRPDECSSIATRAIELLRSKYGVPDTEIAPWTQCSGCGYPVPRSSTPGETRCEECRSV
jgi:hypothetical protein